MDWPRSVASIAPELFRTHVTHIDIDGLTVTYASSKGDIPVLSSVSLTIGAGESLAVIGESGSGKSTLAAAIMGFLRNGSSVRTGELRVDGEDVLSAPAARLRQLRRGVVSLVPQNAGHALTPSMTIGGQVAEALPGFPRLSAARQREEVVRLLGEVKLPTPDAIFDRYPHQLSGGQQQRAAIAMGLASRPQVLVLDEPTTGLDVVTQASILKLIAGLREAHKMTIVLVSHDLGVVAHLCERAVVLYAGQVVEDADTRTLLTSPQHLYSQALISAIPSTARPGLPLGLPGTPPHPRALQPGETTADPISTAELQAWREHAQAAKSEFRAYRPVEAGEPVLRVRDLKVDYRRKPDAVTGPTVDEVSFDIHKGEILALIGESGSGKSTISSAIAGLRPLSGGSIELVDAASGGLVDLSRPVKHRSRKTLSAVQMVFQNADTSLNPRRSVQDSIERPLQLFLRAGGAKLHQLSRAIMRDVGLNAEFAHRLPSQLSGGQRQRVGIARSIATSPRVILADEVVSALDVSVQASVLRLIDDVRREHELSVLFVAHDLAVVRGLADRLIVLHLGRIVEEGTVEDVFAGPNHPYTRTLIDSILDPDPDAVSPIDDSETAMPTQPPLSDSAFADRYPSASGNRYASWLDFGNGHRIKTHLSRDEILALPHNNREVATAAPQDRDAR